MPTDAIKVNKAKTIMLAGLDSIEKKVIGRKSLDTPDDDMAP